VLLNFNKFTIILALGSMPLAFIYPLMKRFTYWPQLFLGITFNYGFILGWTSIKGEIDIVATCILFREPYFGHWDMTRSMDIRILKMMKSLA
jgi:4-hydroxybenzoate polyprenyltransferase